MAERAYKTMKSTGAWNIATGVILMVVGVACGIMLIINGGRLLKDKKEILL